ncbi:MAG: DUF6056 family protein [Lachnospiraceae bacterium]|nr:DUF6056 family protein [Lachnospiraceae bacterium]
MTSKKSLRLLITVFVLALIPLYIIGFYDHPSVDDYFYGMETSAAWRETHSASAVFDAAFRETITTYNEWQGTYAAIFLMRLQPSVWGEKYYVIAPFFLITTFTIAMLIFFYVLLTRWFKAEGRPALAISLCITFCAMQFTHMPADSFYWYNGSIYYTFFFSLMLAMYTLITLSIHSEKMAVRIISVFFAALIGVVIGGGNFVTALFSTFTLFLFFLYYIYKKNVRVAVSLGFILLLAGASFAFSIFAPGNAVRQASVGGSTGVFKALVYSIAYGGYNIASATTVPVFILWILLMPVFYRIASRISFSFKRPLLFALFTFAVFCSQGTPVFYAQGLKMPYRIMNIIYFCYYIFMPINLIYFMGYLHNRFKGRLFERLMTLPFEKAKAGKVFFLGCLAIFSVCCVGLVNVEQSEDGGAVFTNIPMSVSATISLLNGDAKKYDAEMNARAEYLLGTDETDIVLEPLSATPEVLFHSDITPDPYHWKNIHLCMFYNKYMIRLSR